MENDLRDADILDRLGIARVAEVTGRSYKAVHNWKSRGIPDEMTVRHAIFLMAVQDGIALPFDRFPFQVPPGPAHASTDCEAEAAKP